MFEILGKMKIIFEKYYKIASFTYKFSEFFVFSSWSLCTSTTQFEYSSFTLQINIILVAQQTRHSAFMHGQGRAAPQGSDVDNLPSLMQH